MPLETKYIHRPLVSWNIESKKRIIRSYLELIVGIAMIIAAIILFLKSNISLATILSIIGITAIIKSFVSKASAKRAKRRSEGLPPPRFSIRPDDEY